MIVPLLMAEPETNTVQALAEKDPAMLVWWAAEVECAAAIARLEREGSLDESSAHGVAVEIEQLPPTTWQQRSQPAHP